MIISRLEFLYRSHLDQETLQIWIEEEWLVPQRTDTDLAFTEADVARARLIQDLKKDIGVNDEGIGVILNLIDQMHSLRKALAGKTWSVAGNTVTESDGGK